jgi:hypothetical protein
MAKDRDLNLLLPRMASLKNKCLDRTEVYVEINSAGDFMLIVSRHPFFKECRLISAEEMASKKWESDEFIEIFQQRMTDTFAPFIPNK